MSKWKSKIMSRTPRPDCSIKESLGVDELHQKYIGRFTPHWRISGVLVAKKP